MLTTDLVLFYCCFEAIKARDCSKSSTSLGACRVPGEEEVFRGYIRGRFGRRDVLRLFRDMTSPGVRLQATDAGDGSLSWTAFITHTLYSFAWMQRIGPRQISLAEFQRLGFISEDITGQYILKFEEEEDTLGFERAIEGLRDN